MGASFFQVPFWLVLKGSNKENHQKGICLTKTPTWVWWSPFGVALRGKETTHLEGRSRILWAMKLNKKPPLVDTNPHLKDVHVWAPH